jgi:nitrate reductase NapE
MVLAERAVRLLLAVSALHKVCRKPDGDTERRENSEKKLWGSYMSTSGPVPTKRSERRVFLFITVFLFPALFVLLAGGYGLIIWVLQMVFGPPGSS